MTIRFHALAGLGLVLGAVLTLPAVAEPLSGAAIKSLVGGKRLLLSTPYGPGLPLQYKTNGTVNGDASKFSVAAMFAPKESGKWWIDGDRLCQKWPTWLKGRTTCFTVDRTGDSTIKWTRDDGQSGTARIE